MLLQDVGANVRKLIDDHVISLGIDPKVPPIQLSDEQFDQYVARAANARAKASEMEHAIRSQAKDARKKGKAWPSWKGSRFQPVDATACRYGSTAWNGAAAKRRLIDAISAGTIDEGQASAELPAHYLPFLRTLLAEACGEQEPTPDQLLRLKDVTVDLVDLLVQELQANPSIWQPHRRADQEALNGTLFEHLMRLQPPLVDTGRAEGPADKLLQQARANHDGLLAA